MAAIQLEKVTKVFQNGSLAVDELDLEVRDGEFLVLVGPSGCGKTTVLRMVAGLERTTLGTVRIGGRVVTDASPRDRDVAMVFQNYALYPQLTVAENIAFPLKLRKMSKSDIRTRVEAAAETLGLTDWLDRRPAQLSGGQRQRVAMGRAIVREPAVFLMDEPLSNLDAKLRVQMRAEISTLQRRLGVATLYVTHDQVEAMTMGDRVAVLRDGVLQQCDEPQALYDRPANLFVAAFIGSPPMNLYEATLDPTCGGLLLGRQHLELPEQVRSACPGLASYRGASVVVGFRPEHLTIAPGSSHAGSHPRMEGRVEFLEALGSDVLVHFSLDAPLGDRLDGPLDRPPSSESSYGRDPHDLGSRLASTCVARVDPSSSPKVGELTTFSLDPTRLQFFDPDSESNIRQKVD